MKRVSGGDGKRGTLNQAASYFLLAVLSGLLLSVSCLCGECIALKLAPPPPRLPPLQRHNSSSDAAREAKDVSKFTRSHTYQEFSVYSNQISEPVIHVTENSF